VFQIGEVDNGDPAYVGPYQNYLTATLNYPFYWTFKDVFGDKKSMKEITGRLSQEVKTATSELGLHFELKNYIV